MKVSFSGIYDIRYPYGTPSQEIKKDYNEVKNYVNKTYNADGKYSVINVDWKDCFNTQKTSQKLADNGIRIAANIDNPYILSDIFNFLDRKRNQNLVQQYVDKSKVELIINTQV